MSDRQFFAAQSIDPRGMMLYLALDARGDWWSTSSDRAARKFTTKAECHDWIVELGLEKFYKAAPIDT